MTHASCVIGFFLTYQVSSILNCKKKLSAYLSIQRHETLNLSFQFTLFFSSWILNFTNLKHSFSSSAGILDSHRNREFIRQDLRRRKLALPLSLLRAQLNRRPLPRRAREVSTSNTTTQGVNSTFLSLRKTFWRNPKNSKFEKIEDFIHSLTSFG